MPRLGAAARRARLRDRRDRDQGRLDRAAARARRAARAAALGARVQVGADDGDDAPEQDHDPRRPHRRAQPVGDARAGRGRRRHGLARDAAQRGGHQPQGHPRGRRRDRAARGRRDPADRRAGRQAPPGHEAVQDADAVPTLRRGVVKPEGEAMHRCPNRGVPVARARDADQLGAGPRPTSRASASRRSAGSGPKGSCARSPISTGSTKEQLLELDGFGEISATSAIDAISGVEAQVPFWRVLLGLNIPDVGWVTARNLARHFGSRRPAARGERRRTSQEVEGIGPDRAEAIVEWFADEQNRALVDELRELGTALRGRPRTNGRRRAR